MHEREGGESKEGTKQERKGARKEGRKEVRRKVREGGREGEKEEKWKRKTVGVALQVGEKCHLEGRHMLCFTRDDCRSHEDNIRLPSH